MNVTDWPEFYKIILFSDSIADIARLETVSVQILLWQRTIRIYLGKHDEYTKRIDFWSIFKLQDVNLHKKQFSYKNLRIINMQTSKSPDDL